MATLADLIVRVGGDTSGLEKSMESAQKTLKNFGRRTREIGRSTTTFVTAPITAAGGAALNFAADVEEMQAKSRQVFKDQVRDVRAWADTLSDEIRRSRFQVQRFAGNIQDVLVPMGFARDRATELSEQIVQLAFDVASFNNQSDERVLENFKSALVGNSRAVLDYGINIRKSAVDQELMNMGIREGFEAATQQQKVLARLNLMLADTRDAQGDAARTAESFTNTMKGVTGLLHETAVAFGQILIPPARRFLETFVIPAIQWVKNLARENKEWIVTIAAIAAAIGPALIALGTLATVLGTVLPAVLSPLGLLFAAVAGVLVAEVVRLWNSQKTVWENLLNIWQTAKSRALAIWLPLKNAAVFIFTSLVRFWNRWRASVFKIIGSVVGFFREFGSTIVNTVLKGVGLLIAAGSKMVDLWKSIPTSVKKAVVVFGTLAVVFGVILGPLLTLIAKVSTLGAIITVVTGLLSGSLSSWAMLGLGLSFVAPRAALLITIFKSLFSAGKLLFGFFANPAVMAIGLLAGAAFMLWDAWDVVWGNLKVIWFGMQLKIAQLKAAILSWIAEAAVPLINFAQKIGVLDKQMENFGRGLMTQMAKTENRINSLSDSLGAAKDEVSKATRGSITAQLLTAGRLPDVMSGDIIPQTLGNMSTDPFKALTGGKAGAGRLTGNAENFLKKFQKGKEEKRQPIDLKLNMDGKTLTRKIMEFMPGEEGKLGLGFG